MSKYKICIIGLGYVGLPLAVEFATKYQTIGFDTNHERITELSSYYDRTMEVDSEKLRGSRNLRYTNDLQHISNCNIFIITVPTPVDRHNKPDLGPLINASSLVGKVLKANDIVIYESTVYPGVTEEVCAPVLAEISKLKFNVDFFCGYSPERINPGDKEHTVSKILKITSGSTPEIAVVVDDLYSSIINAGTFKASCIKVAEAAKVIENSQRDINIAFVNELAKIFNCIGIDTREVLNAAGTKWNFLKFQPGLVGGHCIGVDPYYLAQKAQEMGYHPEILLAGRRLNDGMGIYIANEFLKLLIKKDIRVKGSKILVLGITFKENCPDIRNSKVIDIVNELGRYSMNLFVHDPWVDKKEAKREYGIEMIDMEEMSKNTFDGVIAAVAHKAFLSFDLKALCKSNSVIFDVKGIYPLSLIDARL